MSTDRETRRFVNTLRRERDLAERENRLLNDRLTRMERLVDRRLAAIAETLTAIQTRLPPLPPAPPPQPVAFASSPASSLPMAQPSSSEYEPSGRTHRNRYRHPYGGRRLRWETESDENDY